MIVILLGIAEFINIDLVIFGQTAPIKATTPLIIASSAAALAALASVQVESTLITLTFSPSNNNPESDASLKASSADSAIAGVSVSIGPVNPKIIPTFISAKTLVIKIEINNNTEVRILNIFFAAYNLY